MNKKFPVYLAKVLVLLLLLIVHKITGQVIISQYYEGNANDKFIEITNISGTIINQQNSSFFLCVFSNEAASNPAGKTPNLVTEIVAELLPTQSILFKNSLAAQPGYAVDTGLGALIGAFNGNDLIIISTTKNESCWDNRIDVIGNGSDWGIDKSLYRKTGINKASTEFVPEDWEEIALSDVDNALENTTPYLGYHLFNCQKPTALSHSPIIQAISDTGVHITWENGNGNSRLVIAGAGQPTSDLPQDGTTYQGDSALSQGNPIGNGFVVYNGWGEEIMITNLSPSTSYFIQIIEFSCANPLYLTDEYLQFDVNTLAPIPRIFTDMATVNHDFGLVDPLDNSETLMLTITWENLSDPITLSTGPPFALSLDESLWTGQLMLNTLVKNNYQVFIRYSPDHPDGITLKDLSLTAVGAEKVTYQLKGTAFPNAWINEFHYDNLGGDEGEFIEVVLQNGDKYNLDELTLQLYNGSDGKVYQQMDLDGFTPGEKAGSFICYSWYPATIQNGNPGGSDGIALSIVDQLIHFLSYEGVFEAREGAANGELSTDIGIAEDDASTPTGYSLQLQDEELVSVAKFQANTLGNYKWTANLASPGEFNTSQVLPVIYSHITLTEGADLAIISWETLTEINNLLFEVQKSTSGNDFKVIGTLPGAGTTNQSIDYQFVDSQFHHSAYYRLRQLDTDGNSQFSPIKSLIKRVFKPKLFTLYPNPFSNYLTISIDPYSSNTLLNATVFSIQGKKILETKGDLVKIREEINQCLGNLPSGLYVVELQQTRQREKHKLLKE